MHTFNEKYDAEHLNYVAFPMGGIGAGMICLEGTGCLSHVSLRHKPDLQNQPQVYAAVCIKRAEGNIARVLEGPVPRRKIFSPFDGGNGLGYRTYGFPRFTNASFQTRMPFGIITLDDPKLPLCARIAGWSPFIPTDANNSSLPVAALEYELTNTSAQRIEGVFSYHAHNFMKLRGNEAAPAQIRSTERGFIFRQPGRVEAAHEEGTCAFSFPFDDTHIDAAWFRGGWFDATSMEWNHVQAGDVLDHPPHDQQDPGNGASAYIPFDLSPGQSRTFTMLISWYVPYSELRQGTDEACCSSGCGCEPGAEKPKPKHQSWYAGRFGGIDEVMEYWRKNYADLRAKSQIFTDCFYHSTLPPEVVEAAAANLTILKSPTVLREKNGRVWAWEGCGHDGGCCYGSCTHVWNYAQAMPHLFADLERSLRLTEFGESQNNQGQQNFRSNLPIRPAVDFGTHAAADGQLGGIMKMHREWIISGDTAWLKQLWPAVRRSLEYCIEVWDPSHEGILREPHHNTYDIEFWGPDGMCCSFYLGALRAAVLMGQALGEDVKFFDELYHKGRAFVETELFNGEYFDQKVQWTGLKADISQFTPLCHSQGHTVTDSQKMQQEHGPKYQYGKGCISDGVLGAWLARVCGVGDVLDPKKVKSHLLAVHRYNLKHDLSEHANPQRPGYAMGNEGGLLLCTWPRGERPALPFVYSDEVWTGIEYQVAAHLLSMGCVKEGLDIVRTARLRYDGRDRNPLNEYECGNWYARAMSSYALLSGMSGASYDAVSGTLTIAPQIPGDFTSFLSTATGFGNVGVKNGKPFYDVKFGKIDVKKIEYQPA